jgi:GST-like protein
VEAALTLIGASFAVVGETILRDVARNPAVFKVDPLGQVPALVLPNGEVMTESAAILIWLANRYPEAALSPSPCDERRPVFFRWMAYVCSAVYGLAWVRGDPIGRWLSPRCPNYPPARCKRPVAACGKSDGAA